MSAFGGLFSVALTSLDEFQRTRFFDSTTGKPRYWYARMPDGRIRLYTRGGYDQQTRAELAPVTEAVRAELERSFRHVPQLQQPVVPPPRTPADRDVTTSVPRSQPAPRGEVFVGTVDAMQVETILAFGANGAIEGYWTVTNRDRLRGKKYRLSGLRVGEELRLKEYDGDAHEQNVFLRADPSLSILSGFADLLGPDGKPWKIQLVRKQIDVVPKR